MAMLLDRYLEHLTHEKRSSVHTVAAYRRDLQGFATYLSTEGVSAIEQADDQLVRLWMMKLMEEGQSARTVNRRLSAVRGFFRFARVTGSAANDPTELIEAPKLQSRLPEFVPEKPMEQLFQREWPEGYEGIMHRCVMELLYGTGMRLAELTGLRPGDVDERASTIRVLGKRNKERILPIGDSLVETLRRFRAERTAAFGDEDRGIPLILGRTGKPLSRKSLQRLVQHYLGGVTSQRKRSPHVL
ncbi:MAG TPA: site-specific integrase, partial [Flavobacteriales bacterium]|nr:site-specific integrase [Flavobacteriales bacterium]